MLGSHNPIKLACNHKPQLIVVVDAEEEFDWSLSANRNNTNVSAMDHIYRVQDIFDQYNITPCYVVDYPVASQAHGCRALQTIYNEGRCEIGAHLHPWVSPPFDEIMHPENTFPGNLDRSLEFEKIRILTETIESAFGARPTSYKAGRYGIGPNTSQILKELGFEVDLSLCPPVDYSSVGGPDFSACHAEPFWFEEDHSLLEIPVTGAFVGWGGSKAGSLYQSAVKYKQFKLPGLFSRISLVNRLMLSPEGFTSEEHIQLTRFLYRQGVRVFTWSFHSPSVVPGNTAYVKNEQELKAFLASFHAYFDFFFNELGGEATTPAKLRAELLGAGKRVST